MIPESHWRQPTEDCPNPELWASDDGMASEYGTADFLYGFVRLLKPRVVVETGCYHGHASLAIGRALKANGRGVLHTCDINLQCVEAVEREAQKEELPIYVHQMTGEDCLQLVERQWPIDLAFIDSAASMTTRNQELASIRAGLVVVHDARDFLGAKDAPQPQIFIPTPRGLAFYQK